VPRGNLLNYYLPTSGNLGTYFLVPLEARKGKSRGALSGVVTMGEGNELGEETNASSNTFLICHQAVGGKEQAFRIKGVGATSKQIGWRGN